MGLYDAYKVTSKSETLWNVYDKLNNLMDALSNDYAYIGGVRVTVGTTAPSSPVNNKELWFDTTNGLVKFYISSAWVSAGAVAL